MRSRKASRFLASAALLWLWLPLSAFGGDRDQLLRWIVPPEPDVAGYRLYLSLESELYGAASDIGFHAPNPQGVASYVLTGLDESSQYFVVMTAYDNAGNESVFSNELRIPPALAGSRNYLLRRIVPPEPDVAGYRVHLSSLSGSYGGGSDIGFHAPNSDRVASSLLTGLDAGREYFAVMTAYDDAGNESVFSNEIRIPPVECIADADCDDGDACNGARTCQNFSCVAGAAPVCPAPSQCLQSSCNAANGCVQAPEPDGTLCNDGDPNTLLDACGGGVCRGVLPECTTDSACSDGDACNGAETCQSFNCVGGAAPACPAPSQCMQSSCDPSTGCVTTPEPDGRSCDDGDPRSVWDACGRGVCAGLQLECAEDAACADEPDAGRDHLLRWIGPSEPDVAGYRVYLSFLSGSYGVGSDIGFHSLDPDGVASYLLRGLDLSREYFAVMTAYNGARNESVLSNEIRIPAVECAGNADCDDGDACNGLETCQAFSCAAGVPTTCATPTQCAASLCDPVNGCELNVAPNGVPCDDGDSATVTDACSAGVCMGAVPECTMDSHCDDGNACNGVEACQGFSCVTSAAPVCPAPSQCMRSSCVVTSGCALAPEPTERPANDGDPDTIGDACAGGICVGVVAECTTDSDCSDGDACNGAETCQSFSCVPGGSPTCPAPTDCTDSFCHPQAGCRSVLAPDGAPCDDGDPLTLVDSCDRGVCWGVVAECVEDMDCDDANLCTVDSCESDSTCAFEPQADGTPCYDFNPDTVGDLCLLGTCEPTCLVDIDCEPGAERDYVLIWTLPPDPDVAGFLLYLGFESTGYGEPLDLEFVPLDPNGFAIYPLAGLDATRTYYALVTAYDATGAEWQFMDEIEIPALACECRTLSAP